MNVKKILYYLALLLLVSCNSIPKDVKTSIRKAGTNRKESQKVIDHSKTNGKREK